MRSILVIGMGTFGVTLATKLQELGNEVMIVDDNSDKIDELSSIFPNAYIANCANKDVLKGINVSSFDTCFVAVAEDFQASLEITSVLQELGAKRVVSKAKSELQAKFLLKCGADEIVFPERDIASKLAVKYNTKNIFDFLSIAEGYGVFEIKLPDSWKGKSLEQLKVREKYRINVIAVKQVGKSLIPLSDPLYVFEDTGNKDSVFVIGNIKDINQIV